MRYLPFAVSAWLFLVGLYGIVTSRNLIHLVACLSLAQSSTYILILSVGFRTGAVAPIFADTPVGTPTVDPITHALTLTDVIVSATITALLLVLTLQLHRRNGTIDPNELAPFRE